MSHDECPRCCKELYTALLKTPPMAFPYTKKELPLPFSAVVTIPRPQVEEFNRLYKEMAAFAGWVCGVDADKITKTDMVRFLMRHQARAAAKKLAGEK